MKLTRAIALFACVLAASFGMAQSPFTPLSVSTRASDLSFTAGRFIANEYANYGGPYAASIYQGNSGTGSSTITVRGGYIVLQDGRSVVPYAPGIPIVINDTQAELITPTAVSGCYKSQGMNQDAILVTCTITANFTYLHGIGSSIGSGTGGAAEALQDAFYWGGGIVDLQPGFGVNTTCTNCFATVNAMLAALPVYDNVVFEDLRTGPPQFWKPTPSSASFLAVPATLTSSTITQNASPAGSASWGSTVYACVALVDIAGNEGACSTTYNFASTTLQSVAVTAPAASTGAVGYTVYLSLSGGSYAFAYQMPITSAVCTLTKLETVTPACALTNSTYGQTGSNAVFTGYPVNTSPLALQLGSASSTTDYVGNSNARTAYAYAPGAGIGSGSVITASLPFTACPATVATTVPCVIGTLAIAPGVLDYVGKEIRVCGKEKLTTTTSSTAENIQLYWDGAGSDTAGVPVQLANLTAVATAGIAQVNTGTFCWEGFTTVAGSSVTAGSIEGGQNYLAVTSTVSPTLAGDFFGNDILSAAVASLNLAGGSGFTSRLHIVQNHTGGTDVSPTLLNATFEVVN